MRRFLIVANKTLGGSPLQSEVMRKLGEGRCRFYVVVPATPHSSSRLVWTQGESRVVAQRRLDESLRQLRLLGADVEGEVGDQRPLTAIQDVLSVRSFDEIIISTLAPGISRWLSKGLPHSAERAFGLPVTHVVSGPELAAVDRAPAPAMWVQPVLEAPPTL